MTHQIELLDPTAAARAVRQPLASRPATLTGGRIGFLSNKKANADLFLKRSETLLRERIGPFESVWASKPAPLPASKEAMDELAQCMAVVSAIAD
jgi:hypothetical protein